jgi:hypothetical protein
MKPFAQQNHYEALEVSFDALPLEIRRAYKKAVALYEDNAIASYSFFSEEERKEILACIEKAYMTLINAEARSAYDRSLTALGILGEPNVDRDRTKEPVAIYDFQKTRGYSPSPALRIDELKSLAVQNPAIQNILAQESLAGADLKKLRMCLQVSLEDISHQTNIRIDILHAIEDENVDLLPPMVYLKGFLKAYSRCLALDEQVVVIAYLKKIANADSLSPGQG